MLTEDEARELLHRAASTIEVAPQGPPVVPAAHRPRWLVPLAAAVAVAVAVGAGFALVDRDAGDPRPAGPATPTTSPAPPQVTVPTVEGLSAQRAITELENVGLTVEVSLDPTSCIRPRIVVRTIPAGGSLVDAGAQVRLLTSGAGSPAGCTHAEGRRIADLFAAFARGTSDSPPVDTPVKLYLGGQLATTISAAAAATRAGYTVCSQGYAERSCPMSAIDVLRSYRGELTISSRPDQCVHGARYLLKPQEVGGTGSVVLSNGPAPSCLETFAVQLVHNDVGQMVAVNLLLGSP